MAGKGHDVPHDSLYRARSRNDGRVDRVGIHAELRGAGERFADMVAMQSGK